MHLSSVRFLSIIMIVVVFCCFLFALCLSPSFSSGPLGCIDFRRPGPVWMGFKYQSHRECAALPEKGRGHRVGLQSRSRAPPESHPRPTVPPQQFLATQAKRSQKRTFLAKIWKRRQGNLGWPLLGSAGQQWGSSRRQDGTELPFPAGVRSDSGRASQKTNIAPDAGGGPGGLRILQ